MNPCQPLTAGVWSYPEGFGVCEDVDVEPIQRLAIEESDIITFHQYDDFRTVKRVVAALEKQSLAAEPLAA